MGKAASPPPRWIARAVLAAAFVVAGAAHLLVPGGFLAITPSWVPMPATVIALTGGCEVIGGIGLVTRQFRWWAGAMLALYAVCVFPANVHHAFDGIAIGDTRLGWAYHGPRLLLQPVIVWWALYAGAVIDWPFTKKGRPDRSGRPTLPVQDRVVQAAITTVNQAEVPVRSARQ